MNFHSENTHTNTDVENPCAAITGVGIISPIGSSIEDVLKSLRVEKDSLADATKIDASKFSSQICGEVRDFNPASHMSTAELETFTDPFLRFAINAARMAIENSGVDLKKAKRPAMVLATCNAGLNSREAEYKNAADPQSARFDKSVSMQAEPCALSKAMAISTGIGGECFLINTACSGSTAAIGLARALVESGKCDVVLAGGADAMALSNYAGFNAIKVLSPQKTAPFSNPSGMNIGEGAAFWIVENLNDASARNAKVYGKIIGHATTADAHHPTQPDPRGDGAYRTMTAALKDSGLDISSLGCINAHGSGTSANDKAEAKAIAKFCGDLKIPATSTKSYTGHCMGATGIIEATCQLLSMNDGFIPPTLHFTEPRQSCEIEVARAKVEKAYDCFLSANYAFAGNNAAVIISKKDFPHSNPPKTKHNAVVITGVSCATPLGVDMGEQLKALSQKKCAISEITRFESPLLAGTLELPNLRTFDRRIDFTGMGNIAIYATIAARGALADALYKIDRDNSAETGLTMAVVRGASEEAHLISVINDADHKGDISCFSNITANSTAGWVSKALEIKGANITLTTGFNCGLQSLEYTRDLLAQGRAKACLAAAADEIYQRQLVGRRSVGELWDSENQSDFKLRQSDDFKTVLSEGSAALLLETEENALARGAKIYGKISAAATTMDTDDAFQSPNLSSDGLNRSIDAVLCEAELEKSDIDLVLWAPRGDAQDKKISDMIKRDFGSRAATCSFNTGYAETTSALAVVAFALKTFSESIPLWPQITGDPELDCAKLPDNPKRILCIASSHSGNNHAVVISR